MEVSFLYTKTKQLSLLTLKFTDFHFQTFAFSSENTLISHFDHTHAYSRKHQKDLFVITSPPKIVLKVPPWMYSERFRLLCSGVEHLVCY